MRRTYYRFLLILTGVIMASSIALCATGSAKKMDNESINVKSFGAKGDGVADDTKAIQSALNEAAKAGGIVFLPAARYLVSGSLKIPVGVHLKGAAMSPQYIEPLIGSVVMATGGHGKEDAPALFELGDSSSVTGLTVFYPKQEVNKIVPYPWTFHMQGGDNTVENITLINSYNGIQVGPEPNVRHRIRSVYGCVLRRGIKVDSCSDIGRIDNVQFHCHWWSSKKVNGDWEPVFQYMLKNCEAFIFGRTDWEYVNNTFVFPVNIGYRFINTKMGSMNGQLSGIGADAAQRCIVVDAIQPMGLLITNGQFVAFTGDDPCEIEINETSAGNIRLVNCAFWGPAVQNIRCKGKGFLSLSDCYFSSGKAGNTGQALVEVSDGKLQIRGSTFATGEPSIHLKPGVKHAIISENNGGNGVQVINEIGDKAVIINNEARQ
ncbi:MAG: glycosyl hydrolase family 28-related protein [Armatimonadota bacterium]